MSLNLIIGRKWTDPKIQVAVVKDDMGISISMDLENFLDLLVKNVGNPTMLMTKAQLKKHIVAAAEKITTEMKDETVRVVE